MSINSWINAVGRIGIQPEDSEEEKIKKSSLTVLALPFAFAGLIWGALYFSYDLILSGFIPFSYGILSFLSYLHFAITKRYRFFRNSQLFLILILPFLLQLSLGGYVPGSGVILWALISPVGALVFFKTKNSLGWFVFYLSLLFIAWLVNDHLPKYIDVKTTEEFINAVFMLNIAAVSSLIFAIQYSYVNKQNELKKTIESRNEELKKMDTLKTRFFANISHEFRTPLAIILGLANKQIEVSKNEETKKDNHTIKNNANRLLELINQLLDISKLESGEENLELRAGDLVAYLKGHYAIFESLARNKKQILLFNGKKLADPVSDTSIHVHFDHEKLQKIMTNLISNAVKFTPTEGIIDVILQKEHDHIKIEISNTGIEIAPEALLHLFDRFYQVNAESTREHEGTGIGLALVKELIDIHLGEISVESQDGKTTFTIHLPLTYDDQYIISTNQDQESSSLLKPNFVPDNSNTAPDQSQIDSESEKLMVLIVEDNPDLRQLIRSILEEEFNIVEAGDGQQGLELATTHVPDLIVSDVMMPKMDGIQLCSELKNQQKTSHIPIVLLTAKATSENKLEGLEHGADDYLIKPFEKNELVARIRNLIQIRKKLQEYFQKNMWSPLVIEKKSNSNDQFLNQVKEITDNNLDNSLFSVEHLSKEIGMSRSQLHRKLKALTNKSATTYIRNYRLYRAAELLKNSDQNISEIAYQVGFSSQTYFSSSFHQLFDCSPTEYQNK